jgi:hypothetical protein
MRHAKLASKIQKYQPHGWRAARLLSISLYIQTNASLRLANKLEHWQASIIPRFERIVQLDYLWGLWEILWWEGICGVFCGLAPAKKHHIYSRAPEIPREPLSLGSPKVL